MVEDKGILIRLFIFIFSSDASSLNWFLSMDRQGVCKGIAISKHSPRVSHLLFADDCLIFMLLILEEVS